MVRRRTAAAAPAGPSASRRGRWLVLPGLLLALFLAYQPALDGGLLWDDEGHITPPALRSADGLRRIWTDVGAAQQYYPALHSAFWIEHAVWGDATRGYHIVNVALHGISAFLLTLIVRRLQIPGAALAGIIFALHPLQVESVAWISEQKNVLSGMFCLAAALSYLAFDDSRRARMYVAALLLFVLALASKTTAAVLPAGLLGIAWWRRPRIRVRHDVVPLLPFFALSAAAAVMTATLERTYFGAASTEFGLSPAERVLVAGRAAWFYLGKFVWPRPLIFNYPRWDVHAGAWTQYLYPLAVVIAIGLCWMWRTRSRAPMTIAFVYLAALSPALGFVDVFPFRYAFVADHFAYLATVPLAVGAAASLAILTRAAARSSRVRTAAAIACAALLVAATRGYSRDYRDAEALYRATIARHPSSWFAQNNLGRLLLDRGESSEAREHLQTAARLQPQRPEPYANLGLLLLRSGSPAAAVDYLDTATRLDPSNAPAQYNFGLALLGAGRDEAALVPLEKAAALRPDSPEPEFQIGVVLQKMGRPADAIPHYRAALQRNPRDAAIHNNLGAALMATGRLDDADRSFSEALALRPDFRQAADNLRRLRAARQP